MSNTLTLAVGFEKGQTGGELNTPRGFDFGGELWIPLSNGFDEAVDPKFEDPGRNIHIRGAMQSGQAMDTWTRDVRICKIDHVKQRLLEHRDLPVDIRVGEDLGNILMGVRETFVEVDEKVILIVQDGAYVALVEKLSIVQFEFREGVSAAKLGAVAFLHAGAREPYSC